MKTIKIITDLIVILMIVLIVVLCSACINNSNKKNDDSTRADITDDISVNGSYDADTEESIEISCPWDEEGAKQPSEYTWEEFEALDGPQQIQFQYTFDSTEGFDEWMEKAKYVSENGTNPWEVPGAKQPSEYTWEEFEALTGPQQIQFQFSFEEFDAWLNANQPK